MTLQLGLFANPIYGQNGSYPAVVEDQVKRISAAEGYYRSRLRNLTPDEVATVKGKQEPSYADRRSVASPSLYPTLLGTCVRSPLLDIILYFSILLNCIVQ
jgi:hypothetical protein